MSQRPEATPLLTVRGLEVRYGRGCSHCVETTGPDAGVNRCPFCGTIVACAEIGFSLFEGEVLGIVGESGSGKTTLVRCLNFDLAPTRGAAYLADFEDGERSIWDASPQRQRFIRNHLMGMVYQNPRDGLDLDVSAGGNIAEKLIMANQYHVGKIRAWSRYLLDRTEVDVARMDEAPRAFSGGMQQRVQIAKALANGPRLLLLDEVTTGLDVSVQARVLDLLRSLQRELRISMLVVSHDLAVVRLLTDRTAVMKSGRIVEIGLTDQILEDPQHPYTQLLVNSLL